MFRKHAVDLSNLLRMKVQVSHMNLQQLPKWFLTEANHFQYVMQHKRKSLLLEGGGGEAY